jgi:hypothetical protein
MVEDEITDGKRIAQFLASELTGLDQKRLEDIDITDADDSAQPSPDGTHAYRLTRGTDTLATVVMYPEAVELRRLDGHEWETPGGTTDITIEDDTLTIRRAASVKQAVDALRLAFS